MTIETAKGNIAIKIEADLSPIAAGNFVALASCGFYDGVVFHRVRATGFVIQGGDPDGTGTGGPGYTIQDEPVTATYSRGTVAMARTSAARTRSAPSSSSSSTTPRGRRSRQANTYQIIGTRHVGHGRGRRDRRRRRCRSCRPTRSS